MPGSLGRWRQAELPGVDTEVQDGGAGRQRDVCRAGRLFWQPAPAAHSQDLLEVLFFSLSLFKAQLCSSEGLSVFARPQHIAVLCSDQPSGGSDHNKEAGTGMKLSQQLGEAVISVIRGRKYSTNPLTLPTSPGRGLGSKGA